MAQSEVVVGVTGQSELPRDLLLEYAGEKVDDNPQWVVSFSKGMRAWILGACEQLMDRWSWQGTPEHVDEALIAISELLARLATGVEMGGFGYGALPFVIPATTMYWYPGRSPTYVYASTTYYLSQYVYTNSVDESANCATFSASLSSGDYKLCVLRDRASNRGKYCILGLGLGFSTGLVDMYYPSTTAIVLDVFDLVVADSGTYMFQIDKHLKNPASGGCHFLLQAVYIRKKSPGES